MIVVRTNHSCLRVGHHKNALLYPDLTCTLLSYRDIRKNGLHVITHEKNNEEFLLITKSNGDCHDILK
jgi:hypothetical protein